MKTAPAVLMVGRSAAAERVEPRLYGMLWSADADPVLLSSGQFRAEAELCEWLRALVEARPYTVQLKDDVDPELRDALAKVLAQRT